MRAFVTGASGVLGRRVTRELVARGHEVVGAVRSGRGAGAVSAAGGTAVEVDLFDADALARAAEGAEVVIHGATSIPLAGARSARAWETNDRLRREGTHALARAAGLVGARRYLQQSIVWVVRPAAGESYDESTPPSPGAVALSAVDGERIALEAGAREGFEVGVLRCGSFYSADAGHTLGMASALRKRMLPIVGKGEALLAPIHADDAATAFAAAAERGSGIYHLVDDHPLPLAEYLRTFAKALGAPAPRRAPVWLVKLLAGSALVEMLSTSMSTTNAKAKGKLGWAPRYPTFAEGIAEVVRDWSR
jgi:nucleoside-diphosphate-sugar epimerase